MAEAATGKKKTNPLVFVGIGCLVLLVLIGIGTTVVMKFFAKKVGTGLLENVIESKTGVKTNIQDLEQGKMTITDPKTGTTVDVGSGSMPENFPKDFPVYPGAKVTSSLSGGQGNQDNGFWLTMSTPDALDKVTSFYKTSLASGGWTVTSTYTANGTTTQSVKKGTMSGNVSMTRESGAEETQIVIILGEESN